MNEAGLVIGEMTHTVTLYLEPDARPAVSLEQWIQFQRVNSATVNDIIASDKIIRIDQSS